MRPVLSPGTRRLWRDQQTLQLGRAGAGAVVLAGLDPGAGAVLRLLDGTRDLAGVERDAQEVGCPPGRARRLLELLHDGGVLVDADEQWPQRLRSLERERLAGDLTGLTAPAGPRAGAPTGLSVLRRRDERSVLVVGAGRVGAPLAALLAAAGVGTVDVLDPGTARAPDTAVGGLRVQDVGRPRGDAARERLGELAPSTRTGPARRPDVVVLAPASQLEDADAAAVRHDPVPHLLAEVRDTVGVVGPLVLPGRGPCLRCLDLTRTDLDPDWPALAVQLASPVRAVRPAAVGGAVLAAAVSAQAAQQVLALIDGDLPASVGGTLELALPDWRWRRRTWPPHPACDCHWEATA